MHKPSTAEPWAGILAAFVTDAAIIAAVRDLQARGCYELDAFGPRPLEELEELIAPQRSQLPRSVLLGALFGTLTGFGVQWFCNAWDLPLNVGGRPAFSLPACIPIAFEITILFGALTVFFGVLWRMQLPHLTHPVFDTLEFESASIDQFWLYVAAHTPEFRADEVEQMLREHGCVSVHWTHSGREPEREPPAPAAAPEAAT